MQPQNLNKIQIDLKYNTNWREVLKSLPSSPGIYIFYHNKNVLYVGKSKNLKNRVSSYFRQNIIDTNPKIKAIITKVTDIEYIITNNEIEALLLEENLIKTLKPKYNVELKDDKRYPFIAITIGEKYPRIIITRKKIPIKSLYFGPYPNVGKLKSILKDIQSIFPYRLCNYNFEKNRPNRVCTNYHIKKCLGVCQEYVTEKEYRKNIIEPIIKIFEGNYDILIKKLKEQMNEYAKKLEFEKAKEIRDKIFKLQELFLDQKIHNIQEEESFDIITFYNINDVITFISLRIKNGKLVGRLYSSYQKIIEDDISEYLIKFLFKYYYHQTDITPVIYIDNELKHFIYSIKNFFATIGNKLGISIKIDYTPEKYRSLLKIGKENAKIITYDINKKLKENINIMEKIKNFFGLPKIPNIIEGFDIAHIQNTFIVGANIRFKNGEFDKSGYRRYKINKVYGNSDYHFMMEIIERRLKHINEWGYPDIILIDGGKAQLNAVLKILENYNYPIFPIAIAKKEELLFIPNKQNPIKLSKDDPILSTFIKIRDEVHRFVNTYHTNLRDKKMIESSLLEIKNLGKKRLEKLFNYFKTLDEMKKASINEFKKIGIPENVAKKIKEKITQDEI